MRTKELDAEKFKTQQLKEENEVLKKKVVMLTKPETASHIQLQKQNENYQKALLCSACVRNLKSHVLLQCMHTFW